MDTIRETLHVDDDWKVLLSFLPESWQLLAKETGALLRNFTNAVVQVVRKTCYQIPEQCRAGGVLCNVKWLRVQEISYLKA